MDVVAGQDTVEAEDLSFGQEAGELEDPVVGRVRDTLRATGCAMSGARSGEMEAGVEAVATTDDLVSRNMADVRCKTEWEVLLRKMTTLHQKQHDMIQKTDGRRK